MLWRTGWVLNTLHYRVEKDLRETVYASETYKLKRWGIWESQVIRWSERPVLYLLALYFSMGLMLVFVSLLGRGVFLLESGALYEWRWLYEWQATLLSVQVTLVGVVLPLGVSLVGILLQSKTAFKAIWSIYRKYSGFLFVGYSCLASLVFIMAGLYAEAILPAVSYTAWCALSFAWVAANIILVGWFIRVTLVVVNETSRDELILRYTINESFVKSIRKRLFFHAPKFMLRKYTRSGDDESFQISSIHYSGGDGEFVSLVHFMKPKYVVWMSFRLLDFLVGLVRFKYAGGQGEKELILPLVVDGVPSKKHVLAVSKGFEMGWVLKRLLRWSFRFSRRKPLDDDFLDDVLLALTGSVSDELKTQNIRLFDQAVDRLVEWHCAVGDSLAFVNDEGEADSWLLLPSSGLFGRSYLDQMLREYYLITVDAVRMLPNSVVFYEKLIYLQWKIKLNSKGDLPRRVTDELIRYSYLGWVALMQWAGGISKVPGSLVYNQYESAILAYVGAWERWPDRLGYKSGNVQVTASMVSSYLQHLRHTGKLAVVALKYGEEVAAEWAVDMIVNWYSSVFIRDYPQGKYMWSYELVTHNILEVDRPSDVWGYILGGSEYNEELAVQIALENAWFDLRVVREGLNNSPKSAIIHPSPNL